MVAGSTGESLSLSYEEYISLISLQSSMLMVEH
nr:hypothetical protein [Orientia tsutsugamushi]